MSERKKVLVTGCSGLVGTFLLTELLRDNFSYEVTGVDIKEPHINYNSLYQNRFKFLNLDLTKQENMDLLFREKFEIVYNCFGVKGSPLRAKTKPVDFLYPSIKINTEIIDRCAKDNIFLVFVSSVGVYSPSEKFVEEDVWKTLPSEHDWFPSWSKRIGELLLESYKVQYGYDRWCIVRPANIFGDYDDYSGNGTVISSTIKKIWEATDSIECWGDGSPMRDFVYAKDVALALKKISEEEIHDVINYGSGQEVSIKEVIEKLVEISGKSLTINWDTSKPNGDLRRLMDTTKQEKYGLLPTIDFGKALFNTYHYYINQFPKENLNFNVREFLTKGGYYFGDINEIINNDPIFIDMLNDIRESCDKEENFGYRFDYRYYQGNPYEHNDTWVKKPHYTNEDVILLEKHIKDTEAVEVQRWWETIRYDNNLQKGREYLRKKIEEYIIKIYPDLKDNFNHQDAFTVYKNGDHITPHNDGENRKRYCVVLIYLSDENYYNNGGGELKIVENGETNLVKPTYGNFAILDFTLNNPDHSVEMVKNDFKRYTYIDFVHDNKLVMAEMEKENIKLI